ncbi:MAG: protein kinase [Pirellulales bacterium]
MNSERPSEEVLFNTARRIDGSDQRRAYLDEACGGDATLRKRVDKLLAAYDEESQYLEQPAAECGGTNSGPRIDEDRSASLKAGLAAAFGQEQSVVVGHAGLSVLRNLSVTLDVPRVALRESPAEALDPIVRPQSAEVPPSDSDSRYRIDGEIARGGMGAILKGRDTDLGRDLAIKVLLEQHKDRPDVVQRFIEEAQIGGQLQHPGIAPVYELGQFQDRRPFFSMKLVKGETFSKLLADRKDPSDERARFVGVFEQVCQTMAYAHSRGVIHRDLKPANVMVGAFGEVQVMDWGLAKVLPAGGVADEKKAHDLQQGQSIVRTLRSQVGSDPPGSFGDAGRVGALGTQTQMGSVMGTPAYMPPEQALGEIDNLDERADVFGLGAILCEVLTGQPPYVASDGTQVYRMASRGKLDDCRARLDACGSDVELILLAKECLSVEPAERPRHAGVVAQRVAGYLASVESRLRKTELERAAEAARVVELNRRRKLHYAIAGLLLVGFVLAGIAANHFRSLEQVQRTLARDNAELAGHNEKLARERELERNAAIAARAREAQLKEEALAAQQRATAAKELSEQKEREARRQYYASDSSNASYAAQTADQFARISGYLTRWADKQPDPRDWEYYLLQTHNQLRTLELGPGKAGYGHNFGVVWSPDQRKIASVSTYPGLEVVDALLGQRLWSLSHKSQTESPAIDWSPDGAWIATENETGTVMVVDAAAGTIQHQFQAHSGVLTRVLWSRDGALLATCSGREIRIWDASDWKLRCALQNLSIDVLDIAWDQRTPRLAACTGDGDVRIYQAETGELLRKWRHEGDVVAWGCTSDLRQMAFASRANSSITLWDVESNRVLKTLRDDRLADTSRLAWRPDGLRLATIGGETRTLWDTETGQRLDRAATPALQGLAWSPDGGMLAAVGFVNSIQIWDAEQTSQSRHIPAAELFCWGQRGECFVTSRQRTVTIWDAYQWRPLQVLPERQGQITAVCISPDECLIVSADDQRQLVVWERETGARRAVTLNTKEVVRSLAFSPDGKWLSGVAQDGASQFNNLAKLYVWDASREDLPQVARLTVSFGLLQAWSPDGRFLLGAEPHPEQTYRGQYGYWDAADRKWHALPDSWHSVVAGGWSPDGRQIVTASGNYSLTLSPISSPGEQRVIPSAHGKAVHSVDWSPTGRRIVSVGVERRARIWDLDSLQQVHEIDEVLDARWDPYGLRLAVRTPQGVDIHDASIGAARGRWTQLLPFLRRQRELGRCTLEDFRTIIEIHVAHQQWDEAREALDRLTERAPDDPRVQHLAAETYVKYARSLPEERRQESAQFLMKACQHRLRLWHADRANQFHRNQLAQAITWLDPEEAANVRRELERTPEGQLVQLALQHQLRTTSSSDRLRALLNSKQIEQARRLAEERLKAAPTDIEAAIVLEEITWTNRPNVWTVINPTDMKSAGGATLSLQEDRSILVGGETPDHDVYTVTAETDLRRITAIRVEALTHDALPQRGPGRSQGGGFVMDRFAVQVAPRVDPTNAVPFLFRSVCADSYLNEQPLDSSTGKWHCANWPGSPHVMVLRAANEEAPLDASRLTFEMTFNHGAPWPRLALGCFRLSVSDVPLAFEQERCRLAARKELSPWNRLLVTYILTDRLDDAGELLARMLQESPQSLAFNELIRFAYGTPTILAALERIWPDNDHKGLLRALALSHQHEWDRADEILRQLPDDRRQEFNKLFLPFWSVGLYPDSLDASYPPETNPNPSQPVAAVGANGVPAPDRKLAWTTVAPDEDQRIRLGYERGCYYLLSRVWSPTDQQVVFKFGDDDAMKLWVNGEVLFQTEPGVDGAHPGEHLVLVSLQSGWNTMLCKVLNTVHLCAVILQVSQREEDIAAARLEQEIFRAMQLTRAGQAGEALKLLTPRLDQFPHADRLHAACAEVHEALEQWDLAIDRWTAADRVAVNKTARFGKPLGLYLERRAAIHGRLRRWELQLADWDLLMTPERMGADNAWMLMGRYETFQHLGDMKRARADIERAVAIASTREDRLMRRFSYWRRGLHFARMREWPAAIEDFRTSLANTDDLRDGWYHQRELALALWMHGDVAGHREVAQSMLKVASGKISQDHALWLLNLFLMSPDAMTDANQEQLRTLNEAVGDWSRPRNAAVWLYRKGRFAESDQAFQTLEGGLQFPFFAALGCLPAQEMRSGAPKQLLKRRTKTWFTRPRAGRWKSRRNNSIGEWALALAAGLTKPKS